MPSAASDGYESTARVPVWRDGHLVTVEVDGWVFGGVGIATAWSAPLDSDELAAAEKALVWHADIEGAVLWREEIER